MDDRIFVRTKRHRRILTVCKEAEAIDALMGELPGETCEHCIVSFCGISAAAFVRWVSDNTVIRHMDLVTFRVGPRALKMLSGLHAQGRLGGARFVVGRLAASHHRHNVEREYWDRLVGLCREFGWQACAINNHAKLILFDTDAGKFVLESSANLNDAPNWEQYVFQQDGDLHRWYAAVVDEMFAYAARIDGEPSAQPEDMPSLADRSEPMRALSWGEPRPALWGE